MKFISKRYTLVSLSKNKSIIIVKQQIYKQMVYSKKTKTHKKTMKTK